MKKIGGQQVSPQTCTSQKRSLLLIVQRFPRSRYRTRLNYDLLVLGLWGIPVEGRSLCVCSTM